MKTLLTTILLLIAVTGWGQYSPVPGLHARFYKDGVEKKDNEGVYWLSKNPGVSYPILHDQYMYVASDAVLEDYVGIIHPNYNVDTLDNSDGFIYSISQDTSGLFQIYATNVIRLASVTGLQVNKTYQLQIKVTDSTRVDYANVYVKVINSANATYVDENYVGTESGTRSQPYNSFGDFSFASTDTVLLKRGSEFTTSSTITLNSYVYLGSYGQGSMPQITSSASNAIQLETTHDYSMIRDIRLIHSGSRGIQINGSDYLTIENCNISGSDIGIRSDNEATRTQNGLTSYTKIIHNIIHNIGLDAIYIESEYTEIAYNSVYDLSQEDVTGDGFQFNVDCYHNLVHHNRVDMSNNVNEKSCIINTTGEATNVYGQNSYTTFEYNWVYGGNGAGTRGGIATAGYYDTVRFNRIDYAGTYAYGNGVGCDNGIYIEGNTIAGWPRGIDQYNRGPITAIQNTIIGGTYGFYANGSTYTNANTMTIKGNIFKGQSTSFISSYSANHTVVSDYNLFDSETAANWKMEGTTYSTFGNLQTAGYDANSINNVPVFTNYSGGDYTLDTGSYAIDNSDELSEQDIIGTTRPQGVASDMGAYEKK